MDPLKTINKILFNLEQKGWIKKTPAFIYDYEEEYPHFKVLEEHADIIEKECRELLNIKDNIPDLDGLAGEKTKGGVQAIKWKSFMFKSGDFIEENCSLCPETADLLRGIPRIKQAFFSILDPEQYIKPHFGYYKGFLRYHLGVIIPNNNEDKNCRIRINADCETFNCDDKSEIEHGESYYWKNGEGIMFNDVYLHDATNESKEIRVVLFIDVVRKFHWSIDWFNRFFLFVAYKTKYVKQIAKNAKVKTNN